MIAAPARVTAGSLALLDAEIARVATPRSRVQALVHEAAPGLIQSAEGLCATDDGALTGPYIWDAMDRAQSLVEGCNRLYDQVRSINPDDCRLENLAIAKDAAADCYALYLKAPKRSRVDGSAVSEEIQSVIKNLRKAEEAAEGANALPATLEDAYAEGRKDQLEVDQRLLAWAYRKLMPYSFAKQEDALAMDEIKLILMGAT